MNPDRRRRIDELESHRRDLHRQLDVNVDEINRLWLEDSREEHPCTCVRLNKDIGVIDMHSSVIRRRCTFGIGLVAELISADRDCALCHGTGVPK